MFALRVELLTGRYVASAYNDREHGEWPPHPARLFSALVSAWAEGDPSSFDGVEERRALEWLEAQPAPSIAAAAFEDVAHRDCPTVFVPVNDTSVVGSVDGARAKLAEAQAQLAAGDGGVATKKAAEVKKLTAKLVADTAKVVGVPGKFTVTDMEAAEQLFPDARLRQPRTFPSLTPADAVVTFIWPMLPTATDRQALARLASRMTYLGHSSSMVASRLVDTAPTPRFVPSDDGGLVLRAMSAGQLARLVAAYERHKGVEPHLLPCAFVRYREAEEPSSTKIINSIFGGEDDWVVLARVAGPRLPSTSAVGVAHQFRRALFTFSDQPIPEVLSGHKSDGSASEEPHVAIVPLPDVGHEHAHGGILGIALVVPRTATPAERRHVLRAVGRFEQSLFDPGRPDESRFELRLGAAGVLELSRVAWGEHRSAGLRPWTWCRPSRVWATATPIALDHNPGDLHHGDPKKRARAFEQATDIVREAVRRIGLPEPHALDVVRSAVLPGTAKPRAFPRFPLDRDRPQRVLVHARLVFADRVRGPVILGAGRYAGLGLCRPLDDGGSR